MLIVKLEKSEDLWKIVQKRGWRAKNGLFRFIIYDLLIIILVEFVIIDEFSVFYVAIFWQDNWIKRVNWC